MIVQSRIGFKKVYKTRYFSYLNKMGDKNLDKSGSYPVKMRPSYIVTWEISYIC